MPVDRDNSVESFEECGFTCEQAEHLSMLSKTRDAMINKKEASCTENMLEFYKQKASELNDEIEHYWQKYKHENRE